MILGILLAAGTGSRFEDGYKLLADLDGEPVVVRAAETLVESSVDEVVAVVGHRGDDVAAALEPLDAGSVENTDFAVGQSTSLRVGVAAARARDAHAVLFALGDLPCVRTETVDAILDAYREANAGIVVPTDDGERGNPVLFDRRHFDELAGVSGDAGGRRLFETHAVTRVAVDDPGVRRDVNTVSDLEALRQCCGDSTRG
jgi:molybdenum cofactor cytidylyltransferase